MTVLRLLSMAALVSAVIAAAAMAQTFEPRVELTVPGVRGTGADVATDRRGNVLVAWWTGDDEGTFGDDSDIVFVRSTDGGHTWSTPALVDDAAAQDGGANESNPRILTDAQGTWLALWLRWIGVTGAPSGVFAARSTDGGRTWSSPVHLGAGGGEGIVFPNRLLAACTDGHGGWLVALPYKAGSGMPPRIARSVDGGQTWGTEPAPAGVVALARCDERPVALVAIVAPDFTSSELRAVVAGPDGRLAGGTEVPIDRRNGFADHQRATLAADNAGRLVASWEVSDQVVASSSQDGTAWSPATPLPAPVGFVFNGAAPFVANGGTGRWLIVWGGPRPRQNVLASADGTLWTQVGERDGWNHAVTSNGAGSWMAAWHTSLTKQVFFGRAEEAPTTTTTTLPPGSCEVTACSLDSSLASGPCKGVVMPRKIQRMLHTAEKLLVKAAASAGRKASKYHRTARAVTAKAIALARRLTRGRRPKLTATCAAYVTDVATALRDGRCLPCDER